MSVPWGELILAEERGPNGLLYPTRLVPGTNSSLPLVQYCITKTNKTTNSYSTISTCKPNTGRIACMGIYWSNTRTTYNMAIRWKWAIEQQRIKLCFAPLSSSSHFRAVRCRSMSEECRLTWPIIIPKCRIRQRNLASKVSKIRHFHLVRLVNFMVIPDSADSADPKSAGSRG